MVADCDIGYQDAGKVGIDFSGDEFSAVDEDVGKSLLEYIAEW